MIFWKHTYIKKALTMLYISLKVIVRRVAKWHINLFIFN
jgi:hypothetical protein